MICRNKITGLSDGRGELLFALVSRYLVKSFMQITLGVLSGTVNGEIEKHHILHCGVLEFSTFGEKLESFSDLIVHKTLVL